LLHDAHQRVVAVTIGPDEADLLDVAEGDAGLRFHSLGRDGEGRPVYYAISLFPGAHYEIEMRQTRDKAS
jgi:GntR family transcriptional regulator